MTISFTIRIATIQDAERVSDLLERTYRILLAPDYNPSELAAAFPVITKARPELLDSGMYFVAETDADELIGVGGWSYANPEKKGASDRTAHIRHFGASPDFTRIGVGSGLMKAVIDQAKAQGVKKYACLSTLTAVPFYAAFGFRQVEPRTVELAGGIPFSAIYMER